MTASNSGAAKPGTRGPGESGPLLRQHYKELFEQTFLGQRDLSEHKQAQEALRESEQRCVDRAELLPETVFETDQCGNLTFVNRNAFNAFGYAQEDFGRGLTALQMVAPEDRC